MALYDITPLSTALVVQSGIASGAVSSDVQFLPGVNSDRGLVAWSPSSSERMVQAFIVDRFSGAITMQDTPVDIMGGSLSGGNLSHGQLFVIDEENFIATWRDATTTGKAQLFTVDSDGNIAANGSSIDYETAASGAPPSIIAWDDDHVLMSWQSSTNDGRAGAMSFDTGTGTLAMVGTSFVYDAGTVLSTAQRLTKLTDTKALIVYGEADAENVFAIVLDVDAGDYDVTAAGSALSLATTGKTYNNVWAELVSVGATIVVIVQWGGFGTPSISEVRSYDINTSTWAITPKGATLSLSDSAGSPRASKIVKITDTKYLSFYTRTNTSNFGTVSTLDYDPTTGDLSIIDTVNYNSETTRYAGLAEAAPGRYVYSWTTNGPERLKIQSFDVELQPKTYDISLLGSSFNYDATGTTLAAAVPLSATRVLVVRSRSLSLKYIQTFDINRTTGGITANGSPVSLGITNSWNGIVNASVVRLSSDRVLVVANQNNSASYVRTFSVDGGGTVTAWGSATSVGDEVIDRISAEFLFEDATDYHVVILGRGINAAAGNNLLVAHISKSTGAVTFEAETLWTSATSNYHTIRRIADDKVALFGDTSTGGQTGTAIVFDINTSTWAISTAGAAAYFETTNNVYYVSPIATEQTDKMVVFFGMVTSGVEQFARQLSVDRSSWDMALDGPTFSLRTFGASDLNTDARTVCPINASAFIDLRQGASNVIGADVFLYGDDRPRVLDSILIDSTAKGFPVLVDIGDGLFLAAWSNTSDRGYMQVLSVLLPPSSGNFLMVM